MGTTSIWSVVGHYNTAMCQMPIQDSTPEVLGRGIAIMKLLEGLLGEERVMCS